MSNIMSKNTSDLFERVIKEEQESLDFGFYWENLEQILEQVRSECLEIKEAYEKNKNGEHLKEEIGDLIHATLSLCVFCQCDPHETLEISLAKYQKRLKSLMEFAKKDGFNDLKNQPMDTLLSYWKKAKIAVG